MHIPDSIKSENEQKETSHLSLIEILWELANRLKKEISILGVVLCLLIAIILIFKGEFNSWAAFTFILIYLIAALLIFYPKIRDEKKKNSRNNQNNINKVDGF